jgi:sugar phosphate isomerase/epimerase
MFEGPVSDRLTWLNELAAFEETLSFCVRIGCPLVVVSAFAAEEGETTGPAAEALRRVGDAAARRGIRVAVLNEVSGAHATGSSLAALLMEVDHASVMAAWSPSAALQAGEDPLSGLNALGKRVALVRCSDGMLQGGMWNPSPLGEGRVDWDSQFRQLRASGFDGPVSLEIELKPASKHGLNEASRLIQLIRQSRR